MIIKSKLLDTSDLVKNSKLPKMGTLYYGDNLEILRDKIKTESVDLIYLDPLLIQKQITM